MAFEVSRIDRIIGEVAVKYGTTVAAIRSRSRLRIHTVPRQECYVRLLDETPMSYPQVARVMRRKDHTTVIYGERVHRQKIKEGIV